VRRNVNGDLKSFTADEVSDGTLTSFVNESFTSSLPLDVAGSAAAAYGLRDLTTGGTSVTSSGDTGGDTTGKFVVQVRRASDNTIKSFTAAEIADGTLVSFVTESFQKTLSVFPFNEGSTWDVTIVDNSNYTFDCNNPTSTVACRLISDAINGGTKYRAEFTLTTNSGDASNLKLNRSSPFQQKNVVEGFNSIDFDFTADTVLQFRVGAGSSVFNATISNLTVTAIGNDGHVKTWYDQSGNSNNATQATAASQPKIVSAGSLLNELDFDGTSHRLDIDFGSNLSQPNSIFMVHQSGTTLGEKNDFFDELGTTGQRTLLDQTGSNYRIFAGSSATSSLSSDTNKNLITAIYNGASSILAKNGTAESALNPSTQSISSTSAIGFSENATQYYQGTMQEFIIYNSDQSDKRRAIEESIATANGITLGSFSRDGFVKTWYDQSVSDQSDAGSTPTGNHATQATADNQPKIVSAGSLVTLNSKPSLEFDGTDDTLSASVALSNHPLTLMAVTELVDGSSPEGGIVSVTAGTSTSSYNALRVFSSNTFTLTTRSPNLNESLTLASTTNPLLMTGIIKTASSAEGFKDGTSAGTLTGTRDNWTSNSLLIGALRYSGGVTNLHAQVFSSEIIVYDSDQTDNRTAIEANIGETYSIDLPSGVDPGFDQVDGFVEAWYDQSGNGNDATQATAAEQPKIVSAGVLVTDSNNNPEIDFNGSNTFSFVNTTDSSPPYTVLSVSKVRDTGTNVIYGLDTGTTAGYYRGSVPPQHAIYSGGGGYGSGFAINTDYLRFDLFNGSSSVIGVNGDTTNVALASDRTNTGFRIAFSGVNSLESIDGTIKEIILYQSDQSAKRTALETNIAAEYGITLS
jgi:hypothetical protein